MSYKTPDLGLAAILMQLGFEFEGICDDENKENTRRKFFAFSEYSGACTESAPEVAENYFDKMLKVEPYAFFNQQKSLKAKLHNYMEQNKMA